MTLDWSRRSGLTVAQALKRIDVQPSAVVQLAGSIFADREAFLVGSLAAGLGNRGSDIDVHVFGEAHDVGLMELFADDRPVEVQQFTYAIPRGLMRGFRDNDTRVLPLSIGPCSTGETPARATQRRMAHWLYALPFQDGGNETVFTRDEQDLAHAVLVRGGIEETLLCCTTAELAARAGHAGAPYLWRRAGRWLLETVLRGAGELFVAEKWLPQRVRRAAIPDDVVVALSHVRDRDGFRAALRRVGLPRLDPRELIRLRPYHDMREVALGRERYLLLSRARLVERSELGPCTLEEAMAAMPAKQLLDTLTTQQLVPRLDTALVDEALS
ncbi:MULTISPECIES: nucleotidyltransferase domain-containing protein [unclassified Streptomyces]|uniref:nucleotidyltransferase domain-containing protein n=1 Tax=unclassified Streptomyces TaxID=2593676 RepID=UPI0004C0DDD8|nr:MULTISPECIES: nucleotidyltransferase domain-containing protein [unclassified Streptomyces]